MIENSLLTGYAQALYEVASKKGVADEVEKDMKSIKTLLKKNEKFRDVLYHPSVTKSDKKKIIDKTIGPQCSKWVKNLLFVLIDKRRERLLDSLSDMFTAVASKIKGIEHVKVQTAIALTDTKREELKKSLEKLTKKEVRLEVKVDKSIIGGMIISMGNRIIDGSVTNHLKNLKKELLKVALT